MAFWRIKPAISLKRVKMEENLLETALVSSYRLSIVSPTPYGLPYLEIGGLQLSYPLLSKEQVKLRTSNLAGTFTGPIRIKAHKNFWRKWSAGVYPGRDCANFGNPYYLGNG